MDLPRKVIAEAVPRRDEEGWYPTVGALIMVHGDDGGLTVPPMVAPTQAVILPIWGRKDTDPNLVRDAADRLRREVLGAGLRVEMDGSEEKQIGWKHNEWTLTGVPLRIKPGPRDVADEQAVLVRRDDPNPRPEKRPVTWSTLAATLLATLHDVQANLNTRALALRQAKTQDLHSFDELAAISEGPRGFVNGHWCGAPAGEATIKERTGATIRCLPLDAPRKDGRCIDDGQPSTARVLFARSYWPPAAQSAGRSPAHLRESRAWPTSRCSNLPSTR